MKRFAGFFSYTLFILLTILSGCSNTPGSDTPVEQIPEFKMPNSYLCYLAPGEIKVDGVLSEEEWGKAEWSAWFRDIEGGDKPEPRFKTRMKMLWDEKYLYVAAELEEPHVWANITKRDEVIFYDNDFEVFIDPNDDTHAYYELEVNAFETAWDLLLYQPYRDDGPAIDSWDIQGLKVGVDVQGTINDPSDTDKGWTVEIAIPLNVLEECAPRGEIPQAGDQWRINFSRVEWKVEVQDGKYQKVINPETGKPFPEDNWVWSPQGYINMHMPEYWGYVQFEGYIDGNKSSFNTPEGLYERWVLRNLYYRQFKYMEENGRYAEDLSDLSWPVEELRDKSIEVLIEGGRYAYQAIIEGDNATWIINEKGKIIKR